jgi:hypothetical protein
MQPGAVFQHVLEALPDCSKKAMLIERVDCATAHTSVP